RSSSVTKVAARSPTFRVQLFTTPEPTLMRSVVAANAGIGTVGSRTSPRCPRSGAPPRPPGPCPPGAPGSPPAIQPRTPGPPRSARTRCPRATGACPGGTAPLGPRSISPSRGRTRPEGGRRGLVDPAPQTLRLLPSGGRHFVLIHPGEEAIGHHHLAGHH